MSVRDGPTTSSKGTNSDTALKLRERRSTQRLFEELRGRGYDGAHDSVHRFVKEWREERARVAAQAFVPMSFAPGEAYQFDWSAYGGTQCGCLDVGKPDFKSTKHLLHLGSGQVGRGVLLAHCDR